MKIRKELDDLLGMEEMESAVETMLLQADEENIPFQKLVVKLSDFKNEAVTGFLHLLYQGWVVPHSDKEQFTISRQLVKQMRKQVCWCKMPYPPKKKVK